MRKIKFRAWDKKEKKMFQVDYINFHVKLQKVYSVEQVGGGELGEQYSHKFNDIALMQFTGLKDKKRTKEYPEGQEIYEGDIIKGMDYDGNEIIDPVIFFDKFTGYYAGYESEESHRLNALHSITNLEVIGNIYENPDLLTK